tara:strand:+ start:308 stop:499 length:192 start_codon:yes stop_codon:yes gene_type:complete
MKKWNELDCTEKKVLVRFYTAKALNDDCEYIRRGAKTYLDCVKNKKVTIEVTQNQLEKIKHLL